MNRLNKSKKEGKNQESIQSSTTPDPGYMYQRESDNVTIRHHKPSLLFSNIVGYFEIMLFDHFVMFFFLK